MVFCSCHCDPKAARIGQFTKGDLEICLGAISAIAPQECFVIGNGWPQKQTLRNRTIRAAFGVAATASHAGKDRVIDAVILSPPANSVVALVALNEAVIRPHEEGRKRERFGGRELRHRKVFVVEKMTVRT